jgi:hypothetical protein
MELNHLICSAHFLEKYPTSSTVTNFKIPLTHKQFSICRLLIILEPPAITMQSNLKLNQEEEAEFLRSIKPPQPKPKKSVE